MVINVPQALAEQSLASTCMPIALMGCCLIALIAFCIFVTAR